MKFFVSLSTLNSIIRIISSNTLKSLPMNRFLLCQWLLQGAVRFLLDQSTSCFSLQ